MKKVIILVLAAVVGVCIADTGSLVATASSVSFTNSGPHEIVYIKNASVVGASAQANTYRVLVTKGSVDYQVATITTDTNSVYGSVVVTNPIPIGNDGVFKISRTTTGVVANVYIDVR